MEKLKAFIKEIEAHLPFLVLPEDGEKIESGVRSMLIQRDAMKEILEVLTKE